MLFEDFSSAKYSILPTNLVNKLGMFGHMDHRLYNLRMYGSETRDPPLSS